jgi:hypothetical protein
MNNEEKVRQRKVYKQEEREELNLHLYSVEKVFQTVYTAR